MAAQLLAQLQQHNPALIQNLVSAGQQQQYSSSSSPLCSADQPAEAASSVPSAAIPSPLSSTNRTAQHHRRIEKGSLPAEMRTARRASTSEQTGKKFIGEENGNLQRQNSAEWTTENGRKRKTSEKEKTEPVWVMRWVWSLVK